MYGDFEEGEEGVMGMDWIWESGDILGRKGWECGLELKECMGMIEENGGGGVF